LRFIVVVLQSPMLEEFFNYVCSTTQIIITHQNLWAINNQINPATKILRHQQCNLSCNEYNCDTHAVQLSRNDINITLSFGLIASRDFKAKQINLNMNQL
jgi:hypothetical protein